MNTHISFPKGIGKFFTVMLALMLVFTTLFFSLPQAAAADEQPTGIAEPTQTDQPSAEPTLSTEPQPSTEPSPSVEPQPSVEPSPSAEPQPSIEPSPSVEPQPSIEPSPSEIVPVNEAQSVSDPGNADSQGSKVIVKFKDGASSFSAMSTMDAAGGLVLESIESEDLVLADVPSGQTTDSFIKKLESQPNVEYAQPNFEYKLNRTFNDPQITSQWYLSKINAFGAWDITTGSPSVRVAVLDTGLDFSHPEFAGQVCAQTDTAYEDGDATDTYYGHGTHVAGIIAGKADNGVGISGVAPGVQLIIVDVFYGSSAYTFDIVQGLDYAVANGAKVINLSFGGPNNDAALEAAINRATSSGAVCVAAAGNEYTSSPSFPSDYDSVISVIATDVNDAKPPFSNFGSAKDISAPGVGILSTLPNNNYYSADGTSMATPVVSGVIALMLSANPFLTVDDIKNKLYSTADDLGAPGKDDTFGYGRVNAFNAVNTVSFKPVGSVEAKKMSAKANAGTSLVIIPPAPPKGYTAVSTTYSSSNPAVAPVEASGRVIFRTGGKATIVTTLTSQMTDKKGRLKTKVITVKKVVSVQEPIKSISLNIADTTIARTQKVQLAASFDPATASNKKVKWTSNNPKIASVSGKGLVTGKAGGTAVITCTATDGSGASSSCTVNVTPIYPASVKISKSALTVKAGKAAGLKAVVAPKNTDFKTVTWTSSDPAIATVDAKGKVRGVAPGTVTITATTSNGLPAVCTVTVP